MVLTKTLRAIVVLSILSVNCLTLPGCSTTAPVKIKWPAVPQELQQPAVNLKQLDENQKTLADLLQNANSNYAEYYLLKEKYETWQQWYNQQQKIYQDAQ